jgi:hypothetical protein
MYIEEEDLYELLLCESQLWELTGAGVDNWEGYGEVDWGHAIQDAKAKLKTFKET